MFGKYAVLDNSTHYFEKEPEWYWKFRPATSGDELAMAKFYAERSRVTTGQDGRPVQMGPIWIEIMWRELAMLFAGTNIPGEDGQPILAEDATLDQVEAVLKKMPEEMVEELWKAMGEAVPGWGPKVQEEKEAGPTNSES